MKMEAVSGGKKEHKLMTVFLKLFLPCLATFSQFTRSLVTRPKKEYLITGYFLQSF